MTLKKYFWKKSKKSIFLKNLEKSRKIDENFNWNPTFLIFDFSRFFEIFEISPKIFRYKISKSIFDQKFSTFFTDFFYKTLQNLLKFQNIAARSREEAGGMLHTWHRCAAKKNPCFLHYLTFFSSCGVQDPWICTSSNFNNI